MYTGGSTTASRVWGQQGSFTTATKNNGGISGNSLNQPTRVQVDAAGDVYISDNSNNRLLEYPQGATTSSKVWGQGVP
jgi:hypothetical protein